MHPEKRCESAITPRKNIPSPLTSRRRVGDAERFGFTGETTNWETIISFEAGADGVTQFSASDSQVRE